MSPLLLALPLARAGAEEWTEKTILDLFERQSPIARETRARVALAQADTRGRTLWANPTLAVSREGAGHTEFYQASQAIPWSGRFPLLREAGTAQSAATEAEGAFTMWNARSALRMAFHQALASQQRRDAWRSADQELVEIIRVLTVREREGEGSTLDRLRAERERVELAASARLADAELETRRGLVMSFLPASDGTAAFAGTLANAAPTGSLPEWIHKALAHRPDLQAERRRLEQFRKEQAAAARLRIPEPVFTAGLKRADAGLPSLQAGPVAGVTLALPLFNQGKTEVARFAAEQERVSARLEQLTRRVQASIEAAWRAYEIHRDARDRYAAQQDSTGDLVRIAQVAYAEGEIGILQWLDALRLRRESRLRQIDLALLAKEAQIALETQVGEEFAP